MSMMSDGGEERRQVTCSLRPYGNSADPACSVGVRNHGEVKLVLLHDYNHVITPEEIKL